MYNRNVCDILCSYIYILLIGILGLIDLIDLVLCYCFFYLHYTLYAHLKTYAFTYVGTYHNV